MRRKESKAKKQRTRQIILANLSAIAAAVQASWSIGTGVSWSAGVNTFQSAGVNMSLFFDTGTGTSQSSDASTNSFPSTGADMSPSTTFYAFLSTNANAFLSFDTGMSLFVSTYMFLSISPGASWFISTFWSAGAFLFTNIDVSRSAGTCPAVNTSAFPSAGDASTPLTLSYISQSSFFNPNSVSTITYSLSFFFAHAIIT